jgi:DNA invertase Pin-like site-specific DNA recombinase
VPDFKYYTPGKRVNGKRTADALRVEALLTQWFETPITISELAAQQDTFEQCIRRVIQRAIKRKPSLAGVKQLYSSKLLDAGNFTGGIANGAVRINQKTIEAITELRAKGMTYRAIGKLLNVSTVTAWIHGRGANYQSKRTDPVEDYGLPHA